jgi:hypothetical protein
MTQADSVHSTPPTNTSAIPSRRNFLTQSVVAAAAIAAALPAAVAATTAPAAADLVALADQFERLVDEYYARRKVWAPRLEQAHAKTDERFGEFFTHYDKDGNPNPEIKEREQFFDEMIDRLAVDEAHDRMHAVYEQMKPLAGAILALPATSIEAPRAKALVAFWEVVPLSARDTEYSFDDSFPFQALFCAVAEFCGLAGKIGSTGYTLPELPEVYGPDDDEDSDEEDV